MPSARRVASFLFLAGCKINGGRGEEGGGKSGSSEAVPGRGWGSIPRAGACLWLPPPPPPPRPVFCEAEAALGALKKGVGAGSRDPKVKKSAPPPKARANSS